MSLNFVEISTNGQIHSLHECHNEDYEKAKQLFSLFDDACENADELIIEFNKQNPDFEINCYIANTFDTVADAFMMSAVFQKTKAFQAISQHSPEKLNKAYVYGTGMSATPAETILL